LVWWRVGIPSIISIGLVEGLDYLLVVGQKKKKKRSKSSCVVTSIQLEKLQFSLVSRSWQRWV